MDPTNRTPAEEPFGVDETPTPPPAAGSPVPTDNEKMLSGLAYVSQFILPAVMPIVLLLSDESKRSPFVRHHSIHSLALLALTIVYELIATVVVMVIGAVVPCLLALVWTLFFLPVVPFVYYGVKAFQGRYVEVPYVTGFLKQNHWL